MSVLPSGSVTSTSGGSRVRPTAASRPGTHRASQASGASALVAGFSLADLVVAAGGQRAGQKQSPPGPRARAARPRQAARMVYRIAARARMTFGAAPPSVTCRASSGPGASCWRNSPSATCATVTASPALTPGTARPRRAPRGRDSAPRPPRAPATGPRRCRAGRMHHHGGGQVVERSGPQQQHLPATGLLGRGAQQHDGQAEFVGDLGQRASATPTAADAMMLCPQACRSRAARRIPRTPTCSGPLPYDARTPSAIRRARRGSRSPLGDQRAGLGGAAELLERQLGSAWMECDSATRSPRRASTASWTLSDAVTVGIPAVSHRRAYREVLPGVVARRAGAQSVAATPDSFRELLFDGVSQAWQQKRLSRRMRRFWRR